MNIESSSWLEQRPVQNAMAAILAATLAVTIACQPQSLANGSEGAPIDGATADLEPVSPHDPDDTAAAIESAVRTVLERQQSAWNRGDLEAFMADYVRGERLRFASGGTVRRGWQTTLRRYQTTYPDRAAMGALQFSQLEITVLSEHHAEVHGRWQLQREQDTPGGRFTLLFERDAASGAWRILHDHTSSDEE